MKVRALDIADVKLIVPKKHVVTFKPGKHMEARVRDLDDGEVDSSLDASTESETLADSESESVTPSSHSGRWDLE